MAPSEIATALTVAQPTSAPTDAEAFEVLRDLAKGKTAPLAPELLARQALDVTVGADFPVRRAALEALLRRLASAKKGGVVVAARLKRLPKRRKRSSPCSRGWANSSAESAGARYLD
ncbi:MAG: hypothetical protein ACOZIN_12755 [Myxococcota bacterium]